MNVQNQGNRQIQRMNSLPQEQNNRQQADMKKIVENYQFWLGNIIAKNQYSQVYNGVQKNSKKPVAIKVIPIQKSLSQKQKFQMQNEIKLSRTFPKHKNIASVYDTFSTTNNYYIMMEKAQVDLKTLLVKKKILAEEQVIPIMLDLLEGLRCISLNGFMHCNIKPSNILVSQDGTAKITDLALMRKINQQQKSPAFQPNQWTPYMHHLTLLTKTYDQNNDLWSLAVTVYQLLHGYHNFPWKFQNYSDLLQKIYDSNIQYSRKVSKQMVDFLNMILNPKNKVTIPEVYNDPFIKYHINQRALQKPAITNDNIEEFPLPKMFKNFSIEGNNKNISPQRPSQQDPFLKFSPQLPLQQNKIVVNNKNNYQIVDFNNQPQNQVKRHVSNYDTSSSPQKVVLKNQHTYVENNQRKLTVREILDCQISFMRFINIVLKQDQNGYVLEKRDPNADQKLRQLQQKKQIDHLLFRFVLIKQVLGQKDWLKRTLDIYHPQNPFNINGIEDFIANYQNRQVIKSFLKVLDDYDKKYFDLQQQMQKLIIQISSRLQKIKCQWRPRDILTSSLQRKQILPILGVRLSRQICKHIWHEINTGYSILSTKKANTQKQANQRNIIISQMEQKARRVDFLMTYYILNCLLIDDFLQIQYFVKNSALSVIMNNKPTKMEFDDFRLVQEKLKLLQMI